MSGLLEGNSLIQQKIEEILHQINANFKVCSKVTCHQQGGLTPEEEEKLSINILFKISTYFIELTELCMSKVKTEEIESIRTRLEHNKENIQCLFNKRSHKLKSSSSGLKVEHEGEVKRQSLPEIIENMKINKPKHPVSSFFFFFKKMSPEIAITTGEKIGSKIAKIVAAIWKSMNEHEREPYEKLAMQTRSKYDEEMKIFKNDFREQIAELKRFKKGQKKLKKESQSKKEYGDVKDDLKRQEEYEEQPKINNPPLLQINNKSSDMSYQSDILSDSLGGGDVSSESNAAVQKDIKKAAPSNSSIKLQNKPKAPVSSFFIYYQQNGKSLSQAHSLSLGPKMIKIASEIWNKMSEQQKEPYNEKAEKTRKKYYEQMNKFRKENAEEIKLYKKLKQQMKKTKKGKE